MSADAAREALERIALGTWNTSTDHLMLRGRRSWASSPICAECKTRSFPRGFVANTGRCWTCQFPRAAAPGGNPGTEKEGL